MGRVVVPWVIDLIVADAPDDIALLADDPRFDRGFEARGPLFNRLLAGRIRRALRADGRPLPSVAPREAPGRVEAQAALERRLTAAAPLFARGDGLGPLVAYVRGEGPRSAAGVLAQHVVGRAFATDFEADAASWADAQVLDAAPRSFNPFRRLFWALTGRVGRARDRLFARTGSGAGVHATGIAVHNLVRGIERMRTLWADERQRRTMSVPMVVAHCLFAPRQVMRQAVRGGSSPVAAAFGDGALALLRLGAAQTRDPGPDMLFLTEAWSRCPAHAWVPALLAGVWSEATEGGA